MKKIILLTALLLNLVNTNAQCWKYISTGANHILAIKKDSTLWAWGDNSFGQLGNGANGIFVNVQPIQIGMDNNWKQVFGGRVQSFGIRTDGTLWAWGNNFSGQLGDGTNVNKNVPTQVGISTDWRAIFCGGDHTLAIKTDGTLWGWGWNNVGQLGDGTIVDKNIPILISALNWLTVAAGAIHSMAIKTDGTLWAWGSNTYGQLGDGTNIDKKVPVQIGSSTNWKTVFCGGYHTVAIKTDGTLWAWGWNNTGQLGDGTLFDKNTPVQIGTAVDWQFLSAGAYFNLAIKTDSTLHGWGSNIYGQLGDGTNTDRKVPVRIGIATNWQSVITGAAHSFGQQNDSTRWVWGYNGFGQLGNTNGSYAPVELSPCAPPLPVILMSFNAQKQGSTAILNWQTAAELNSREYQIERSTNGIVFNSIGVVASNNNTAGSIYRFRDAIVSTGRNYYRLKSVDIDGRYNYSYTIEVTFDLSNNIIIIYPNPARDILSFESNFKGSQLTIGISEISGKKIVQYVKSNTNNQKIDLPIANLNKGMYLLTVTDGIDNITQKIIKN